VTADVECPAQVGQEAVGTKEERKIAEDSMKKSVLMMGAVATLILGWSIGRVQGQQDQKVVFVSSAKANYQETNSKGVWGATLWGDPTQGAHGTFSKFAPGYDAGLHTHTNDVWIVVVKGAYLYKDDAGEKRVGVGDFLRVPGGHQHWSGGDKKEGAVFYEESSGKFDLIPAK
jgi:quercetin dioxygenase-like cupin family protein